MMKWLMVSLFFSLLAQEINFSFNHVPRGSDTYTQQCFENYLALNEYWIQQTGLDFSYDSANRTLTLSQDGVTVRYAINGNSGNFPEHGTERQINVETQMAHLIRGSTDGMMFMDPESEEYQSSQRHAMNMIRTCRQSTFPLVAEAAAHYERSLYQIDLDRPAERRRQREEYEASQELERVAN